MAQWRAVPSAVWTAVGALAFLAAAGVAVVLGAGLHVWSGPATPGAPPPVSGARPGGSGVVTVPPRTTTVPGSPRSAGPATTPVAALPFVPFLPATTSPAGQPAPVVAPPASGPVAHPQGRALGLLRTARQLALVGLRDLRSATDDKGLRSAAGRLNVRSDHDEANAARHSRHGLGKGHAAQRGRHHARHGRHHARAHEGHHHHGRHGHGHGRSHGKHDSHAQARPAIGHARHYDD